MLARTRALAPDGTRVSRLAGKSVGVAKSSAMLGVSTAADGSSMSVVASGLGSSGCGATGAGSGATLGAGAAAAGRGVPPGSILRGSVGWSS